MEVASAGVSQSNLADLLIMFIPNGRRAPAPLYCGPKTSDQPHSGFWDYNYECK